MDVQVIEQAAFRLMHLAKVGIHPRIKVVVPDGVQSKVLD